MMRLLLLLLLGLAACRANIALLGGVRTIESEELESPIFDAIRKLVVDEFNARLSRSCVSCNPGVYHTMFHVEAVRRQVVRGVRYWVEFTLVPTRCNNTGLRGQPLRLLRECKLLSVGMPQKCSAEFFMLNRMEVRDMKCIPAITTVLHRSVRSVSTHEEAAEVGSRASFMLFKAKFGRSYKSEAEEEKRYQVFRTNMQTAHILNRLELGTARYGHTPFADMTEAEFRHTRLSPVWDQTNMPERQAKPATRAAPTSFDWREHGAVTAVKNQAQCGSCWAFSTTGNVEGQWAIKKGSLISLSEQELVDCDKVDQGCGGGLPSNAYKAIMRLGGLETEKAYPYEARNDQCHFQRNLVRAYINSSVSLPQDETKLAAWLAQNSPISIGINAFAMQFYMGGISHPWSFLCNPSKLDHGVLIVGYGVQNSEPYWIIKNSWGASWGEQGYYLVYRGSGVCGLNRMATSALVD